jgi:hypothetical protein
MTAPSPAAPIRPKDRDTVLQALRAGVVPRAGLHLIQVGRAREIQALVGDLERIADGGSSMRLIVGDYGSGKTFFLTLVRAIAHEKGLVTAHADLNPDRRLHGAQGQARSFYQELMRNLATRTKPDAAMSSVVERFISTALQEARQNGAPPENVIHDRLQSLSELTNGYTFAEVISRYYAGHEQGNDQLKQDAVRWLRGSSPPRRTRGRLWACAASSTTTTSTISSSCSPASPAWPATRACWSPATSWSTC